MSSAKDVAIYFLQLDKENKLFSDTTMKEMNGRKLCIGSARLNKYLHLAQNIYYAKTGYLLFPEKIYAFDNGGVVEEVRTKFFFLLDRKDSLQVNLPEEIMSYLRKIYEVLRNATIDDLIELSHQDREWEEKHMFYKKEDQIMDTESHLEEYRKQYSDIITLLDRMPA